MDRDIRAFIRGAMKIAARAEERQEKLATGLYERGPDGRVRKVGKALRPFCGARTRAGGACRARAVFGKARCRLHGGCNTGPKTAAGRLAIAASNRRRAERAKAG